MEVGTDVWCKDGNEWLLARVTEKAPHSIVVTVTATYQALTISFDEECIELDSVKLCNDQFNEKVDNLVNLPHLHEPAVLHCLEMRYMDGDIYTYTGPILIAVNPFKRLDIYGIHELNSYYSHGLLHSQGVESAIPLPPHVFAIADAAYHGMIAVISADPSVDYDRPIAPDVPTGNQSILISGESGAGKTESTKIVLKYLTTVGSGSTGLSVSSGSVMDKILQSNPILEAFGNAATLRNDNSSRFGKFIQLAFNSRGHLIGGSIDSYLLEKVRLPFQQQGQRNFHIFYQMAAGGSDEDKTRWGLHDITEFKYTNQGGVFHLKYISDEEEYNSLLKAFKTLRFPPDMTTSLLQVMAAILHLGQVQFTPDVDGEGSEIEKGGSNSEKSVLLAADLLGVSVEYLLKCVTVRNILAMNEVIEKRLKVDQASDARDALVRHLYAKLFSWIVDSVNVSIDPGDAKLCRAKIGVLDIFGFECFDKNSFEQLCINYTNESLQQQFNHFMFKTEQAEYEREKIDALLIEFMDNQDCLDLIDKKPVGIIAVLDDECRLPKGSDKNFSARLYKLHTSTERFSANPTQIRNGEFVINHFAGGVCYSTAQFVDKNRDELPKECTNLFASSSIPLLSRIFSAGGGRPALTRQRSSSAQVATGTGGGGATATQRVTVGSQFREQLAGLLATIHTTAPHYIRCLKPNDQNTPDRFTRARCNEQLRYGGVLEAVRVARLGFPVRLTHAEFYSRYQPLANPFCAAFRSLPRMLGDAEESPKEMCVLLLSAISDETLGTQVNTQGGSTLSFKSSAREIESSGEVPSSQLPQLLSFISWRGVRTFAEESVQLGLTKVFFRKHAHDILEGRRSRRLVHATVKAQSCMRGYLRRSMFLDMRKAAMLIQRVGRGMLSRVQTHLFRIHMAATKIQAMFRSYTAYFSYNQYIMAVVVIQSSFRSRLSRKSTFHYWFADKIIRLQHVMIRLMYRWRFVRYRRAVIYLQAACRRRRARDVLKNLRGRARDLGTLQQSNDVLKAEIKLLRRQASAESTRAQAIQLAQNEYQASLAKDVEIEELNTEIVLLKAELQEEQNARSRIESQLSKALKSASTERKQLNREISDLKQSRDRNGGLDDAAVEQLRVDLEMTLEDLARETALRKTLENEVDRLTNGGTQRARGRTDSTGSVGGGPQSPLYRGSPRAKSSIPRYIGSPMAPSSTKRMSTPTDGGRNSSSSVVFTPDQHKQRGAGCKDSPTTAGSAARNTASSISREKAVPQQVQQLQRGREKSHRDKELTSSTHFMRKRESKVQRRKQDLFRAKLKQGMLVFLYDHTHNVRKKALLRMDVGTDELYLCNRMARYSSVPTKMSDVKPINFSDILECVPGALMDKNTLKNFSFAEVEAILSNQCFLTIVSLNTINGSRNLILLLETREERNSLLQNIRALSEEVQGKSGDGPSTSTPNTPLPPSPSPNLATHTPNANIPPPPVSNDKPKVPPLSIGGSGSKMSFASPTTASRRKALNVTGHPASLDDADPMLALDTPRTAQKRHDLFEKASARKHARHRGTRSNSLETDSKPATPFVRNEDDAALWNPELRSYEQPTRSFLKSAEVATAKLNTNRVSAESIWRPGGVSSPYLSHKSLASRPPLLKDFDEVGEQHQSPPPSGYRPPHIDTENSPHEKDSSGGDSGGHVGSPSVSLSSSKRRWSVSSNGSGTGSEVSFSPNRSPMVRGGRSGLGSGGSAKSARKSSAKKVLPSITVNDSEECNLTPAVPSKAVVIADTPAPRPGHVAVQTAGIAASPILKVDTAASPSPTRRAPRFLKIDTAPDPGPDAIVEEEDTLSSLPPKPPVVPNAPTPSRRPRTPDGGGGEPKAFSFKGYMLDEASAALSQQAKDTTGGAVRYTAATANLVSPGGRIKEKISNPSPSLQRFLAMSQSAQMVKIPPSPPTSTSNSKAKKFSFDILETVAKELSSNERNAELERLKSERLQRQQAILDAAEALQKKEKYSRGNEESQLEVGKRLEQALLDKQDLTAQLKEAKEHPKIDEYEDFY